MMMVDVLRSCSAYRAIAFIRRCGGRYFFRCWPSWFCCWLSATRCWLSVLERLKNESEAEPRSAYPRMRVFGIKKD
jgi:hypothetical protein